MMRTLKDVQRLRSETGGDVIIRWWLGRWVCSIRKPGDWERHTSGTNLEAAMSELARAAREAMS